MKKIKINIPRENEGYYRVVFVLQKATAHPAAELAGTLNKTNAEVDVASAFCFKDVIERPYGKSHPPLRGPPSPAERAL